MFLFDSMNEFFLQRYNPVASGASAPSSAEKIKRTHRRTNNFIQMVNLERHLVADLMPIDVIFKIDNLYNFELIFLVAFRLRCLIGFR